MNSDRDEANTQRSDKDLGAAMAGEKTNNIIIIIIITSEQVKNGKHFSSGIY